MVNKQIADDKIDQAYYQAVAELKPKAEVEQAILQLAHASVPKASHWSAFPVWAQAASVAGLAVLGWWLLAPAEAPRVVQESQQEVEVIQVSGIHQGEAEGLAQQAPVQARTLAAPKPASPKEQIVQVTGVRSEVKTVVADEDSEMSASVVMEPAHSSFRACLQSQVVSFKGTLNAGLPEGISPGYLDWAPQVKWQERLWRVVEHKGDWSLVGHEETGWQWVELPKVLVEVCEGL